MNFISLLSGIASPPTVQHYVGLPSKLASGTGNQTPFGSPQFLVILETSEGTFLYRFERDGTFAGDTWHTSLDEAKQQAVFEYDSRMCEWCRIPDGINDLKAIIAFGTKLLAESELKRQDPPDTGAP